MYTTVRIGGGLPAPEPPQDVAVFLPETLLAPPEPLQCEESLDDPPPPESYPLALPPEKRVKLTGGGGYRGAHRKEYEPEEDRLILQLHAAYGGQWSRFTRSLHHFSHVLMDRSL